MKTLNLIDLEKSDIKYKKIPFPDGQHNIVILHKESEIEYWKHHDPMYKTGGVEIKSRLNNWLDLELISCSIACLKELGVEEIHLYVPYIMGARSDRKFEEGGNNYLKDVICPAINALGCKTVTCINPHSDCLEMGIKGFRKKSNLELVEFTLSHLKYLPEELENWQKMSDMYQKNGYILVSPDAGASKKIYKLAEQIGYKGDIITCSKDRDENGKLTKCVVPINDSIIKSKKDYVIIDDICDGGATFINISKEIKATFKTYSKTQTPKIYLIVTHGIFSKGFTELSKYFDGIYCTNSYKDLPEYIMTNKSKKFPSQEKTINLVKQLNVF